MTVNNRKQKYVGNSRQEKVKNRLGDEQGHKYILPADSIGNPGPKKPANPIEDGGGRLNGSAGYSQCPPGSATVFIKIPWAKGES
jgi:hypothetical protein